MSNSNGRSPQAQIVVDAIDRLPPTERALLDLSVRHELDDDEIGAIVGLDPSDVTRLRLGVLERMSSDLTEAGLGRWGALGAALNEVGAEARTDEEEDDEEEEDEEEEAEDEEEEAEDEEEDDSDEAEEPAGAPEHHSGLVEEPAHVPEHHSSATAVAEPAAAPAQRAVPEPATAVARQTLRPTKPPPLLTSQLGPARRRTRPKVLVAAGAILVALAVVAIISGRLDRSHDRTAPRVAARRIVPIPAGRFDPLGNRNRHDIYAADRPNNLSPVVRNFPERVYVPNSRSNTVDVIDPHTFKIVDHFATGMLPQHVTPSWDLRKLWVLNDLGNSLTPINPRNGHHGKPVPVDDPYNMYYAPDGKYAIVVAEQRQRLDFRKPKSMQLHKSVHVPCFGVDHMDFTADGRYLLASCEFSGQMVVLDVKRQELVKTLEIRPGAMPQDVKLSPDGRMFYVADMASNGVWLVGAKHLRVRGFINTGRGAHGLYASRDSKKLYVSNRGEGSISVISFRKRQVVTKWVIPGGGSPDMGGVSADGKVLWLTGRYNAEVYAISTEDGHLIKRIPVGQGPHGLCIYPQPGRYSLGHTGVFR